ncbi:iron-sulfur cluster assembly scaffold protein [Halomonas sp. TRM85114]|uniref:iron-sulfur cluster assembly scaffold protein n=1 Tax=Halomonas jincaotanensis TaxID=2810616 RepID=UPI001BD45DDF|nr:iron-sulfur cluster assembly scaffold protein [Halomonas jincaotanensis]MBS9403298.1 iron-sulfur cluster assembly scaffold protein [Halomonas jincaotanensis]
MVASRPLRLPDCLERGLRTRRAPPLPIVGDWVETPQGLRARFSLAVHEATIAEARFEATPCATLVAYCEALAEYESGRPLTAAPGLEAQGLISLLAGVPPGRRDRAFIAVAALRAAIQISIQESTS